MMAYLIQNRPIMEIWLHEIPHHKFQNVNEKFPIYSTIYSQLFILFAVILSENKLIYHSLYFSLDFYL